MQIAIHAEIASMQIIAIHAEIVTLHDVARASLLLPKMKQSSASGAVEGKRYFVCVQYLPSWTHKIYIASLFHKGKGPFICLVIRVIQHSELIRNNAC